MSEVPELWDHQKQCVEKLKDLAGGALLCEVGTGKTPAMVTIMRHKYNSHKAILPTLILGPPIIVANWRKHILTFSKTPPERVVMLTGPGSKRLADFKRMYEKWGGFFIAITNYESMQMKPLYEEFQNWLPGGMLICDESQRMKNGTALRTKKVTALADLCRYRYIMTGTPVLNSPMDIFAQYRIMDGGKTFGKNFFAFRGMYFYDKNSGMPKQKYFPNWVPRSDTEERLGQLMEATSFQAKKAECLSLPPLTRTRIDVSMTPEQARAYEEMKRNFITVVKEEACVAELAITKTLRLQQIISGFVRTAEGNDVPFEKTPRLQALSDLLEDIAAAEKVIVWTNWIETYGMIGKICDDLGLKHVFLTGQQTKKQKDESVEAFEKDPSVRVIIGNPRAGGVGIDLIAASSAIYFTRSYSLEDDLQSIARCYRGGSEQHKKITRYDLVCPGTIDEVVLNALESKGNVADSILSWARGHYET